MENPFAERMAELPDIELFKILKQKEDYQELAVEAAKNEIRKRNLTAEETKTIVNEMEAIEIKEEEKKNIINNSVKQFFGYIKNLFIPLPSGKKSPAVYINSLAILIIAGLLGTYIPMIYYDLIFRKVLGNYSHLLFDFGTFLILFAVAVSLFKKKKFGWIMVNFFMTFYFFRNLLVFYFDWTGYSPPEAFPAKTLFYIDLAFAIIPFIIVKYLNKPVVTNYFRINRIKQNITLFVSILAGAAYFIIWTVFLPEYYSL